MKENSWLTKEEAVKRLTKAGYETEIFADRLAYRAIGKRGNIYLHPQGVDEHAIIRIEQHFQ